MHKMVKSKTPYKVDYFDFLNNNLYQYTDYFVNLKDNPFTNRLHLSYLSLDIKNDCLILPMMKLIR